MNKRTIISLALVALVAAAGFIYADTSGYVRDGQDGSTGRVGRQKTTYDSSSIHTPHVNIDSVPFAAANFHAPAANTAAVVTKAAVAGKKHVITGLIVSYTGSGTLAGGNVIIEDVSGTTVFSLNFEAKGTFVIPFPTPMRTAAVNTAMIVTLAAGSANVSGVVNLMGYHTE